MKKFLLAAVVLAMPAMALATDYPGNGATGFGGPIGLGTLSISDDGSGNITFSVSPNGGNLGGNAAVLYIDSKAGGVADTSTLTDTADGGRSIVSGVNSGNPSRTVAVFPGGFDADYGIAIEPGSFEGVFDLSNPANFPFVTGNGVGGNGPYSVTISRAQLGLGATDGFSVVGNELSGSIYRSNETFGNSIVPVPNDGGGNPGFSNPIIFTSAITVSAVPEPTTIGLIGLGAIPMMMRRRRA